MVESASLAKQELRRGLRARRRAVAAPGRCKSWTAAPAASRGIAALMEESAGIIATYYPVGSEADPAPLAQLATDKGWHMAFPRVTPDGQMHFHLGSDPAGFVPDAAGVPAPDPHAPPALPDVLLLPLVGFDVSGTRLGQGGGHYDRAIAQLDTDRASAGLPRALRIGVAWDVQEVAHLPREAWDCALDIICTETRWIKVTS